MKKLIVGTSLALFGFVGMGAPNQAKAEVAGQNESWEVMDEELNVEDGKIIINIDYGYAIEITFEPDTPQGAMQLIAKSAKKVINDPDVQREAAAIFLTTGSAYKAARYIAGKVMREVVDSAIFSIKLIEVA